MLKWLRSLFFNLSHDKRRARAETLAHPEKEVFFSNISVFDKTPSDVDIANNELVAVVRGGKPYWALFRCPCGCETVISLSLQSVHNPNWILDVSKKGRPTIYPSVWQNCGCYSHFWIEDGYVYWCFDTGSCPSYFQGQWRN